MSRVRSCLYRPVTVLPKDWTDSPARLKAAHCAGRRGVRSKAQDRATPRGSSTRSPQRCRSLLSRRTACMAPGTSRPPCARQARAMSWASPPTTCSALGARSCLSPVRPLRSRKASPAGLAALIVRCRNQRPALARLGLPCELADLEVDEYSDTLAGDWTQGLLIRRNIADGDLAFFSTWCPRAHPLKKLVAVEGHRAGPLRTVLKPPRTNSASITTKRSGRVGTAMSLVMLAFAMMAVIRHHANTSLAVKKTSSRLRSNRRS